MRGASRRLGVAQARAPARALPTRNPRAPGSSRTARHPASPDDAAGRGAGPARDVGLGSTTRRLREAVGVPATTGRLCPAGAARERQLAGVDLAPDRRTQPWGSLDAARGVDGARAGSSASRGATQAWTLGEGIRRPAGRWVWWATSEGLALRAWCGVRWRRREGGPGAVEHHLFPTLSGPGGLSLEAPARSGAVRDGWICPSKLTEAPPRATPSRRRGSARSWRRGSQPAQRRTRRSWRRVGSLLRATTDDLQIVVGGPRAAGGRPQWPSRHSSSSAWTT